jgi:integrase
MTPADVQELAATSGLAPRTTQAYVRALKMILDFAGVDPNPARDRHVRLPRIASEPMNPPSWKHVEAIVANVRKSLRLPVTILAETGVRVGELLAWTWGDVDTVDCKIRVPQGKTAAAMRWVQVRSELMDELLETCPPDDRAIDRRLFPELGRGTLKGAIRRACVNAGISRYSPHDFRHRHISVLLKQGLSRAEVAASVGHSNTNTLAVYEHVIMEAPIEGLGI